MKLFNTLAKKVAAGVAIVAAVVGITSVAIAGFGPDRQTYTLANPADHVTFNSIIDNTTVMGGNGDERAFSTGAIDGASNWSDPVQGAADGQEVTIRAYVHNNAKADLNLVAENVTFKVELPTAMEQVHQVKSTISSSNATPTSVFDTLDISASNGSYSQLEYIPGSAKYTNNHFTGGVALSDSIVTSGATLGFDQLNGKIPGCLNFSGWVTLKVKVKVPAYTVAKTARLSGEGADKWRESVNAVPGDKIDYRIEFVNHGSTSLDNIRIYDKLPSYMKVVPGTVKLIDGANPTSNPYVFPDSAVTSNGTVIDVTLSNSYPAQTNAFVRFQAEFVSDPAISCETTKFTNIAYAQPSGLGSVNDGVDVYLVTGKTCEVVVVKECKSFEFVKINRTTFDFTATANVSNANVTSYVFTAKDKNGNVIATQTVTTSATSATYHFVKDAPGTYTVSAVINTDKGVATGTCEKTVTVEEIPVTPVYSCDAVSVDKIGGRKVRVTVNVTNDPKDRVQIKNYEYNFGDGSAAQVTDKNPNEYEYAKDGTYSIKVKVNFTVDGVMQTASGDKCAAVVTFAPTPTTLPRTGSSSTLGVFIVTTMLSMIAFRAYAVRKN